MNNTQLSISTPNGDPEERKGRAEAGKYLTFHLGSEEYGFEILRVHEIIGMMTVTPVPRTPAYVKGVINLRGKVIPIIDLRLKLGMPAAPTTDQTCIIVVQTVGKDVGVIVDSVSEVLDILAKDLDDTPGFGASVNSEYVLGVGKTEGRVRLLLDVDPVLSGDVSAAGKPAVNELSQLRAA